MEAHTREALEQLCQRLGADPERAPLMASQLIKRAQQMSAERNISEVAAMNDLLRMLIDPQKEYDSLNQE